MEHRDPPGKQPTSYDKHYYPGHATAEEKDQLEHDLFSPNIYDYKYHHPDTFVHYDVDPRMHEMFQ